MPSPISHDSIIFPAASTSISSTLSSLKRSNLSLSNRLRSIAHDTAFVVSVAQALQLPLVANERCGSWYVAPGRKEGSAYFKSTDGHFGEWGFSLRRLNLQVLDVMGGSGGCIILDSTRRGKSMPDALSKTVGIWIAVLNRLLFPLFLQYHALLTPSTVVSDSEHAQIESRLDGFVADARSLELDLESLRAKVKKPMKPVWVTPATDLETLRRPDIGDEFATIVLCTASSRASEEARDDPSYVQGAADDSEAWALGLDAVTFWANSEMLLAANEDELPGLIARLVAESSRGASGSREPTLIRPTQSISIGDDSATGLMDEDVDVLICCGRERDPKVQNSIKQTKGQRIHLPCTTGKTGSRQLRSHLPKLEELQKLRHLSPRILVTCHTGRDLSVGIALALLCMYCSSEGRLDCRTRQPPPNKAEIKKRLSWIMASMPDASPSRATLQSVNAFLMG